MTNLNLCLIAYLLTKRNSQDPFHQLGELKEQANVSTELVKDFNLNMYKTLNIIQNATHELEKSIGSLITELQERQHRLSDLIEQSVDLDFLGHIKAIRETTDKLSNTICGSERYGYSISTA